MKRFGLLSLHGELGQVRFLHAREDGISSLLCEPWLGQLFVVSCQCLTHPLTSPLGLQDVVMLPNGQMVLVNGAVQGYVWGSYYGGGTAGPPASNAW